MYDAISGVVMLNNQRYEEGEVFEPGQVWISPKGVLWSVIEYGPRKGNAFMMAVLRLGSSPTGRKVRRPWDATSNWVLFRRKDGTKTGAEWAF